jgi:hypothetical protein
MLPNGSGVQLRAASFTAAPSRQLDFEIPRSPKPPSREVVSCNAMLASLWRGFDLTDRLRFAQ